LPLAASMHRSYSLITASGITFPIPVITPVAPPVYYPHEKP